LSKCPWPLAEEDRLAFAFFFGGEGFADGGGDGVVRFRCGKWMPSRAGN